LLEAEHIKEKTGMSEANQAFCFDTPLLWISEANQAFCFDTPLLWITEGNPH